VINRQYAIENRQLKADKTTLRERGESLVVNSPGKTRCYG